MATTSITEPIIITDKKAVRIIEDGLKKKSSSVISKKRIKEIDKMEHDGVKLFKKLFLK